MADVVNIGKRAKDVRKSDQMLPYSKVIINVAKNDNSVISYEAGNDTGMTLEIDCPWGDQQVADNMLEKIRGYQYQPYTVTSAIIDPATELGDATQTNGVYGGIYQQDSNFAHTFYSDFSAPQEEEVDHEYTYETPIERRLSRQESYTRATFSIQHDNIEAKVAQKGGDVEDNSFAWRLLADHFSLYSGSKEVFKCHADGILVDGEIRARTGYIGSNTNGFHINDKSIFNGKSSINAESSAQAQGVYVGTDGIALGMVSYDNVKYDAFSVTKNGVFTARTGYIGNGSSGFTINNKAIYNGTKSLLDTTQGTYLGIDGIRVYNDDKNSFTFNKNGTLEIKKGMTSISDTTNSSGMFIGNEGIVLGGGKIRLDRDGTFTAKSATLTGSITAKSGRIGADSNGNGGFYITSSKLYSDGKDSYDSTTEGVYIGTNGIGLGAKKFYVTKAGKLYANDVEIEGKIKATSGSFKGSLTVDSISFSSGVTISGDNITDGTVSGGKISDGAVGGGKIADGAVSGPKVSSKAISKAKTSDGVQTSLDNGDTAIASFNSLTSGSVTATTLAATTVQLDYMRIGSSGTRRNVSWYSVKNTSDQTIWALGYRT